VDGVSNGWSSQVSVERYFNSRFRPQGDRNLEAMFGDGGILRDFAILKGNREHHEDDALAKHSFPANNRGCFCGMTPRQTPVVDKKDRF
jgi:hypothetical protein